MGLGMILGILRGIGKNTCGAKLKILRQDDYEIMTSRLCERLAPLAPYNVAWGAKGCLAGLTLWFEAIARRLEAITRRLEAIGHHRRLEAITRRLEAIGHHRRLEAITRRLEAIGHHRRLEAITRR